MTAEKARFVAALAKTRYTLDDVAQWQEHGKGVWLVLIHTHRVVWYTLTSDGQISPM